jgi:hypothetical protein
MPDSGPANVMYAAEEVVMGQFFPRIYHLSLLDIIRSISHAYLYLSTTSTKRTSWRNPGTFKTNTALSVSGTTKQKNP